MTGRDALRALAPVIGARTWRRWLALLALSAALGGLGGLVGLPAALLLGSIAASMTLALSGAAPRLPRQGFILAQGVIACMVASTVTPPILRSLHHDWKLFVFVTLAVVGLCAAMGWALALRRVLPGTTAVWGSSPGGAAVMTAMSESHGGDMSLVAFMQYLRVVMVALAATLVAHVYVDPALPDAAAAAWFPPLRPAGLALTLLLGCGGAWVSGRLRLPGGPMLCPMMVAGALNAAGVFEPVLPPWLLAMAFATLGWNVGIRFTRQSLHHATAALPAIVLSILCLLAVCGALAAGLHHLAGIDPLTAYLATSPGGLESVAIIAAGAGVNVPFVMAFQTVRLLIVVLTGPLIARWVAGRVTAAGRRPR
ncbi:MAG: AbrB family transcriptional regulator [Candidatus Dactylopiibacterium sp.]|nr:AbrB family transcriptional regulator [Candidatus Dactylopiibacterium sp.]